MKGDYLPVFQTVCIAVSEKISQLYRGGGQYSEIAKFYPYTLKDWRLNARWGTDEPALFGTWSDPYKILVPNNRYFLQFR